MELGGIPSDLYAGYVIEDSDLEYSECSDGESSEEESCSRRRRPNSPHVSSEDEFEKEMDSEIMSTLELMVSPTAMLASKGTPKKVSFSSPSGSVCAKEKKKEGESSHVAPPAAEETKKDEEYYDDIYFDSSSGSEDEESSGKRIKNVGKKVRKLTNDELFYDPLMDEEDEKWVKRQRMAYHNVKVSRELEQKKKKLPKEDKTQGESKQESGTSEDQPDDQSLQTDSQPSEQVALPRSDAVLNCPACMTTLCLDCQRHDFYVNQYRAMFVVNCCVVMDEVLTYMPKADRKSRKRNRKARTERISEESEKYNPVRCSKCNTEVAVCDKDEVFHFFNVLASAA